MEGGAGESDSSPRHYCRQPTPLLQVALAKHDGWAAEQVRHPLLAEPTQPPDPSDVEHQDLLSAWLGDAGAQIRMGVRHFHGTGAAGRRSTAEAAQVITNMSAAITNITTY